MKARNIVAGVLLLFVAVSVAYLVFEEVRSNANSRGAASREIPHKVILYYFHGNFRCPTCRKFETYAHEAITSTLADQLKQGKLEWAVVNIDEAPNEHFVQDYEMTTRSLVVVDMKGGKQSRWKNLEEIWDLVRDREAFEKYVVKETRAYLEAE